MNRNPIPILKPSAEDTPTLAAYIKTEQALGPEGATALVAHMQESHRFAYSIRDTASTYHIYCRFGGNAPDATKYPPSDISTWMFREHGTSFGMRPASWSEFESLAATYCLGSVEYRYD